MIIPGIISLSGMSDEPAEPEGLVDPLNEIYWEKLDLVVIIFVTCMSKLNIV